MPQIYIQYCDQLFSDSMPAICPSSLKQTAVSRESLISMQTDALPALNSTDVTTVFGVAFTTVMLFFLIGRGVGSVLSLIRKG